MATVGVEGREVVDMLSSCFDVEENDSKRNLDSSVELDNVCSLRTAM